ncbi:hypothetical protein WN51_11333 [Melipona quadrifasciata]|uniref:Uncharacterized protein n=1 Tax=Melipona quadrifasciata TaxID=166423 RepID=A0A0M9AB90_9HYME|nr:hypothetical protein WN51_11333 [Melipona quadrifasciata]
MTNGQMSGITHLISSVEFHYQHDCVTAEPALNNHLVTTGAPHRVERQADPFRFIDQLISDVIQLPGKAIEQILNIVRSIFSSIRSAVESLLNGVETLIDNLVEEVNGTNSNTGGRRRRSTDPAPSLPDLILNPFNNVRKMLSQVESTTGGEIETIMNVAVQTALNFLSTQIKIVSDKRTTFLFKGTSLEKCIVNIPSKREKETGIKSSMIFLEKVLNLAHQIQNILVIVVRQFDSYAKFNNLVHTNRDKYTDMER